MMAPPKPMASMITDSCTREYTMKAIIVPTKDGTSASNHKGPWKAENQQQADDDA